MVYSGDGRFYMPYDDFGGKVPLYVHLCLMMRRIDSVYGTVTSTCGPTGLVPKVVGNIPFTTLASRSNNTYLIPTQQP